jgi:acyl-CoA thioester hydrolase
VTSIRITVRPFEIDALGHVNQAVYHQYGELARVAAIEEAGGRFEDLLNNGVAPVLLESHIVFRRELRARDIVDVSCDIKFGTGKTFHMDNVITKLDGTVSAEITCIIGIMDLTARKLLPDPRAALEKLGVRLLSSAPAGC